MTDDEIRDLFREMRDETVPADSLARVRLGLEARVQRRARWKFARWAMAGVAVLVTALLFPWGAPIHKPAGATVAVGAPSNPPLNAPQPEPRMTVRPAIQRTRRHRPRPSQAAVIRIETPDPDVVILLVGE
jgi:hypothetical protein